MKRTVSALLIVAGAVGVAAWWQPWAAPEASAPALAESNASVSTVTAAQMGYSVSIDPTTGEFKSEAEPVDVKNLPESLQNALSTSTEGLVESPGTSSAGGYKLDVQGRFHSASVARIDADGTLEAPCLSNETDLENFVADVNTQSTGEKE